MLREIPPFLSAVAVSQGVAGGVLMPHEKAIAIISSLTGLVAAVASLLRTLRARKNKPRAARTRRPSPNGETNQAK